MSKNCARNIPCGGQNFTIHLLVYKKNNAWEPLCAWTFLVGIYVFSVEYTVYFLE